MKIKIIGSNSSNRMKLQKNVMKVIESLEKNIDVEILDSEKEISKYGVTNTPGLVINEKLVSQGKVINEKEIKHLYQVLIANIQKSKIQEE